MDGLPGQKGEPGLPGEGVRGEKGDAGLPGLPGKNSTQLVTGPEEQFVKQSISVLNDVNL